MIIDLSKPRNDYFEHSTPTDVLRRALASSKTPRLMEKADAIEAALKDDEDFLPHISDNDLLELAKEGLVVVGGAGIESLETVLNGEKIKVNHGQLIEALENLRPEQALILPTNYEISDAIANNIMVYHPHDHLLLLWQKTVRDRLADKLKIPRYSVPEYYSASFFEQHQVSPELLIGTAFDMLHDLSEVFTDKILCSYSWKGKDGNWRRVSLYRAHEGAELRAFQNIVAYKLLIPLMKKELRTGINSRTREKFTEEQRKRRESKIRRYEDAIDRYGYRSSLRRFDVVFQDLIEPKDMFSGKTQATMRVPSRDRDAQLSVMIDGMVKKAQILTHQTRISSLPVLEPDDKRKYSMVWNIIAMDEGEDCEYSSVREGIPEGMVGRKRDLLIFDTFNFLSR